MLEFYLFGVLLTFSMMMFIFLKARPWEEEDGLQDDKKATHGAMLACMLCILFMSLFSWVAAIFLFAKRVDETR